MADERKPSLAPDPKVALARKLTGGQRIPGGPPSSAPSAPDSKPSQPSQVVSSSKPSIPSAPKAPVSMREAVLASRREAVANKGEIDMREFDVPSKPPPADEPRVRPVWALLVVAGLAAVIFFGVWIKNAIRSSSPEGKVHETLVTWELTPTAGREAVFQQIDALGPSALPHVLTALTDATLAERGDSHSTRQVREVAHLYLMRLAANAKVPPPKQADDIAKSLFMGTPPTNDQWAQAQGAWKGWVEGLQAKGTLPKP